jgi:hypothetical protein
MRSKKKGKIPNQSLQFRSKTLAWENAVHCKAQGPVCVNPLQLVKQTSQAKHRWRWVKIPMVETSCLECVVRVSILSVTMKCGQIRSLPRNVDRVGENSYTKPKKRRVRWVRCPMFDPGPSRQQNLVKSYMGIGAKYGFYPQTNVGPQTLGMKFLHVFPRIPFEKWWRYPRFVASIVGIFIMFP